MPTEATETAIARSVSPLSAPATSRAALSAVTAAVAPDPVVTVLPAAATPVAPPLPANPIVGVLTEVAAVVNNLIYPNLAVPPTDPLHLILIEVVRRIEVTLGLPVVGTPIVYTRDPVIGLNPISSAAGTPTANDEVQTPYGGIGKWLQEPGGQISDFGGQQSGGRTLVEPINVIIVDSTSTTEAEAIAKLNASLRSAGFPAQPIHSTGFQGTVGGETFGQQPTGLFEAYSNNFFLLPDDHARAFGPGQIGDGPGYVWSVAASRELFGLYGLTPTHTFLSYNAARDELSSKLLQNGATLDGIVALSNAVDTPTQTTADHDGYAIVVRLA